MVFVKFAPLITLACALANAVRAATLLPYVDTGVHRVLKQQGTVNLIVTMADGTSATLDSVKEADFTSRGDQIASMVDSLESAAMQSQAVVTSLLGQEAEGTALPFTNSTSFWISNQLFIENATVELLEKLMVLPEIQEIREELVIPLTKPTPSLANFAGNETDESLTVASAGKLTTAATIGGVTVPTNPKWGVKTIKASNVWATGNIGQNVVIGQIDTGVRATHTALKTSFLGSFGWYDPEKQAATPYDPDGHGTHTMGTIAGGNGIGVAPGAKWIACKGCRSDECRESELLACAQFITCPTDPTGKKKDCSKAPRVVNNSWSGGQGDSFFNAAIKAWLKAGIVPVFANGNSGPECTTAESSGDVADVIAVGATDSKDMLGDFSSRGPAVNGLVKPDVSAPGVNVYSASNVDDTSYRYEDGTSMAAPHVSGAVALILSANPDFTVAQVKNVLLSSTDTASLQATGQTCGGTKDGKFPNNMYGYGRINVLSALS